MAEIKKSDKIFAIQLCSFSVLGTQRNVAILFRVNYLLKKYPFTMYNSFFGQNTFCGEFQNIFGEYEH